MDDNTIDSFRGEFGFLSNFHKCRVEFGGLVFNSAEAAYQSQKCPERAHEFVGISAAEAKRLGKQVEIRPDWDQVKLAIMSSIVMEKFKQNTELMDWLTMTEDAILVEGNAWGDTFWGMCKGKGMNWLGKILMIVRATHFHLDRESSIVEKK